MKRNKLVWTGLYNIIMIAFLHAFGAYQLQAQICNNPANMIFGMTPTADVHYVNVSTGAVGARINPANSGTAPNLANAMGYNPINGRLYYFKRNIQANPQEFVVYDPITGYVNKLANCPSNSLINLGCCTANGAGYYCVDAFGALFYYRIASNTWVTISTNLRDQANRTLAFLISGNAAPNTSSRIYGDVAIDGSGNMWMVISGPNDFGVYKIPSPLPIVPVTGALTIFEQIPPTTPTPGLKSIGGVAFAQSGEMFISTNAGDNKLYRLEKNYSLTYLSTITMDGLGTDLTSCNYPMFVLPVLWKRFAATLNGQDNISLAWSIVESEDTKSYLVEHSIDGVKWEELAALTANGKIGEIGNYAYEHTTTVKGKHFYRVGRTDMDNRTSFSDTKVIYTYGSVSFALWPNPAHETLQIETSSKTASPNVSVLIADQTGRTIFKNVLAKGINQLDVRKLSPGSYLITLIFANGEKVTHKFLKN